MKSIRIFLIANLVAVCILSAYVILFSSKPNTAFVLNQKVFEGFTASKMLTEKLNRLKKEHALKLDSLETQIDREHATAYDAQYFQKTQQQFALQEQELAENYTADLWKKINQYLVKYGQQKKYEYIFGAVGNGNLMYASDARDITTEVIQYINQQYDNE